MSLFDQAFDQLLGIEGGYSDRASDRGGKTQWGITEAVARRNGYTGPMDALPVTMAKDIYRHEYWDALALDDVAALSVRVADDLFDCAVNCGQGRAALWFQRALNIFNRQGQDYQDIREDGQIGSNTIAAFRALLAKRRKDGETVMLRAIKCLKGAHYIDIGTSRPANEDFEFGWFLNRVAG